MIDLGLSAAQEAAFEDALTSSHEIRITVELRDHNEAVLHSLTPDLMPGSAVQMDATADVTHSCSLIFLDPNNKLHFDAANPSMGALYADNFVSVEYGVYVESISKWVDVPVFYGPLTAFSREGPIVTIEAQGKETLLLDPHLTTRGYTVRKGRQVDDAIKDVVGRTGEAKTRLGMLSGRLHRARTVSAGEVPWFVLVGGNQDRKGRPKPGLMTRAKGSWYLYYNARGYLTAKRKNRRTTFTFKHDKHVLTTPGYRYDILEMRNHAEVKGGVPKGSKHHVRGEYSLPANHPLSPQSLSRNGKARFMSIFQEADNLKTTAACREKARNLVEAVANQGIEAQFESLPIPHLEAMDVVTLRMSTYSIQFPLRRFTLPLEAGGTMAVGFNKKAKFKRGKRRRRSY